MRSNSNPRQRRSSSAASSSAASSTPTTSSIDKPLYGGERDDMLLMQSSSDDGMGEMLQGAHNNAADQYSNLRDGGSGRVRQFEDSYRRQLLQRRRERESQQRQLEEEMEACTFKPAICPYTRSKGAASAARSVGTASHAFARLSTDKKQFHHRNELERRRMERESAPSFAPVINHAYDECVGDRPPAAERLYKDAFDRADALEVKIAQQEAAIAEEYGQHRASALGTDFFSVNYSAQEDSNARKQRQRQAAGGDGDSSARKRTPTRSSVEGGTARAVDYQQRQRDRESRVAELRTRLQEQEDFTFRPSVNRYVPPPHAVSGANRPASAPRARAASPRDDKSNGAWMYSPLRDPAYVRRREELLQARRHTYERDFYERQSVDIAKRRHTAAQPDPHKAPPQPTLHVDADQIVRRLAQPIAAQDKSKMVQRAAEERQQGEQELKRALASSRRSLMHVRTSVPPQMFQLSRTGHPLYPRAQGHSNERQFHVDPSQKDLDNGGGDKQAETTTTTAHKTPRSTSTTAQRQQQQQQSNNAGRTGSVLSTSSLDMSSFSEQGRRKLEKAEELSRARAERKAEEEAIENCTFKPKLNTHRPVPKPTSNGARRQLERGESTHVAKMRKAQEAKDTAVDKLSWKRGFEVNRDPNMKVILSPFKNLEQHEQATYASKRRHLLDAERSMYPSPRPFKSR